MPTSSSIVTWHGSAVLRHITDAVAVGMAKGGVLAKVAARNTLSTPFPPASQPGQPPHRRTGDLRRANDSSIRTGPGLIEVRIGVLATADPNVRFYAGLLAKGTPGGQMKARPWLDREQVGAMVWAAVQDSVRSALR